MDAFLRGECRTFQVGLRAQLLRQSRTLHSKNRLHVSTCNTPRWLHISLAVAPAHLLVGNRGLLLIGQLHQRADICAQISLAANEEDSGAGTKVQDLSFPLRRQKQAVQKYVQTGHTHCEEPTFFRLPSTVSGRLMSKHSNTASESL